MMERLRTMDRRRLDRLQNLIILLLAMLAGAGYFAYSAMAVEGEPIPTEGYVALGE